LKFFSVRKTISYIAFSSSVEQRCGIRLGNVACPLRYWCTCMLAGGIRDVTCRCTFPLPFAVRTSIFAIFLAVALTEVSWRKSSFIFLFLSRARTRRKEAKWNLWHISYSSRSACTYIWVSLLILTRLVHIAAVGEIVIEILRSWIVCRIYGWICCRMLFKKYSWTICWLCFWIHFLIYFWIHFSICCCISAFYLIFFV